MCSNHRFLRSTCGVGGEEVFALEDIVDCIIFYVCTCLNLVRAVHSSLAKTKLMGFHISGGAIRTPKPFKRKEVSYPCGSKCGSV